MENPGTFGMILALAVGIVKVLEKTIEWYFTKAKAKKHVGSNGNSNGYSSGLNHQTEQALKEIHAIVQLRDTDGVPMVYWPRSQMDMQKEIAETLHEISNTQERMFDKLDVIADNTRSCHGSCNVR